MKLGAEVGEIIQIFVFVRFVPIGFLKPEPTVIDDFRLRSLQLERRVPRTAVGGIEARSKW